MSKDQDNHFINTPQGCKTHIDGISIHSGIAIGQVYKKTIALPDVKDEVSSLLTSEEVQRFESALEKAVEDINALIESTDNSDGIFEAHSMILRDPELKKQVISLITKQHLTAESAFISVVDLYKNLWQKAGNNGFMAEKSSDITDVAIRVLRHLDVRIDTSINPNSEVILVVNDLSPSEALKINTSLVKGVVCASGNQTSHSAILVRSLGVPAVFGAMEIMESVLQDQEIILDGSAGKVFIEFDEVFRSALQAKQVQEQMRNEELALKVHHDCITDDGIRIRTMANISIPEQVSLTHRFGADGIGLFRTEFIYLNRDNPPTEDEQYETYRSVVEGMNGKPVTFRTADFGGDKPIPYLGIPKEDNPFLGLRGIRYSLRNPELLKTQLRAIYRTSSLGPISIMFPMISTFSELKEAIKWADEVKKELIDEGHKIEPVPLGIMIEVPSAVIQIEKLLMNCDFASIGTNDLAQYVMATDRLNPVVGNLASGCQPALLVMIEKVLSSARKVGKPVSICGEMAGDELFTEILFGFGLREFSMSHDLIPRIKDKLSRLRVDESQIVAQKVLEMDTSDEVHKTLSDNIMV
jgi:phosphoenolpyruvate-protein phosphotransferase (PTS system enzyme I)